MKLKKLLAGALAAVVAVTTIAVSAFTTASADSIEPDNGWYNGTGTLEGDQFKLIQDWDNSTKLSDLYQQSELYITFDVTGITTPIQAYMIFSNGADWQAWTPNESGNPAIPISKNGTYTVAWNGTAVNAEVVLFLAVAFIDQSGAKYYAQDAGVKVNLKSVTLEKPAETPTDDPTDDPTDEPPTDEPTPGISAEAQLTFQSGGYEWTNWGGDTGVNTTITGDGTYTAEVNHERSHIEGMGDNATKVNVMCVDMNGFATTLGVDSVNKEITLAEKKQLVLDKGINIKDVTVTVDEGTEYEDSITLDNDKLLFGDIEGNGNFRIEIWNTYGNIKPDLPEGSEGLAYYDPAVEEFMDNLEASDSIKVTFTIEGIGGEQQPTDEPPTDEPPTDEPTEEPTTEPADVTVSVIPDKAYAMPGDEVTYTIHVDTKKVPLYTVQMRLVIPEGMTYVENSGAIVDGVQEKLGYDNVAWTEQSLIINGYASAPKSVDSFDLATFKCKVDEGLADGTELAMDLTYLEFTEEGFAKIANVAVAAGVVTVGEDPNPTEPSTEPTSDDTTQAPTNGGSTTTPTDKPAGNNNNNNNNNNNGGTNTNTPSDKTPNTGAATAVGLSIFMAAGLAGAVAIKRRRK